MDTTGWGHGEAKTATALWEELQAGEALLLDDPPVREIQVVQLVIRRDGLVLHEIGQALRDGRRRVRDQLPAEKVIPGETILAAARRGLWEELRISPASILTLNALEPLVEEKFSPSYPGLLTRYRFFPVEATIAELSAEEIWTEGPARAAFEPVVRHWWGW